MEKRGVSVSLYCHFLFTYGPKRNLGPIAMHFLKISNWIGFEAVSRH